MDRNIKNRVLYLSILLTLLSLAQDAYAQSSRAFRMNELLLEGSTSENYLKLSADPSTSAYELSFPSSACTETQVWAFDATGNIVCADQTGGSGSGELNNILNPSAQSNTDGWVANGTASVSQVDSGSETLPLEPVIETALSIQAGTSADVVRYRFPMADKLKNVKQKVQFYWNTDGVTVDDEFQFALYTNTASDYSGTYTQVTFNGGDTDVPLKAAGGRAIRSFDAGDESFYELRFITPANGGFVKQLLLQNVIIGPGAGPFAVPAVTAWESFTPTFNNDDDLTPSYATARKRRVGDSLEIQIRVNWITTDGTNSNNLEFVLPDNLTSTSTTKDVGRVYLLEENTGGDQSEIAELIPVDNQTYYLLGNAPGTGNTTSLNGTNFGASSGNYRALVIEMTVPIAEWQNEGTVNIYTEDNIKQGTDFTCTGTDVNIKTANSTCRYYQIGPILFAYYEVALSGVSPVTGNIQIDLPPGYTYDDNAEPFLFQGSVSGLDVSVSSTNQNQGLVEFRSTDNFIFYDENGRWDATNPFSWDNSDRISFSVVVPVNEILGPDGNLAGFAGATAEQGGLVTTGEQTFAGAKTLNNDLTVTGQSVEAKIILDRNDQDGRVELTSGTSGGFVDIYDNTDTRTVRIAPSGDSYLNGGNVGIGTSSPSGELEVADSAGNANLIINGATGSDSFLRLYEGGSGRWSIYNDASDGDKIKVADSGGNDGVEMAQNANAWSALSDERYKENWVELDGALNKIKTLRAGTYNNIYNPDNLRKVGLIAQDVLKVLPEAVDTDNPDKLTMRYTDVVPLLTKAIQEQQAIIEDLKQRIEDLEQE